MSIHTTTTDLEHADAEEVMLAIQENRPIDPEVSRRVEARADAIRAKLQMLPEGTAVELVRSIRDE